MEETQQDESLTGGVKLKKQPPKFTIQTKINEYLLEHVPVTAFIEEAVDTRVANVVGMKCPMCGSDEIYAESRQTRSADEAMTVFYTCLKCGWRKKKN